jgi:hypothetical protein
MSLAVKRWWPAAAGAAALAFIVTMLATGGLQESRQLIKFEAKGLMQVAPELIDRAELEMGSKHYALTRSGLRMWSVENGAALDGQTAANASMAVQFMNSSAPTREISAAELSGIEMKEFGLDQPRLSVTLYRGPSRVITAHFGTHNPDGLLQYMSVEGRGEVYLMSRFVGEQWEQVAGELAGG